MDVYKKGKNWYIEANKTHSTYQRRDQVSVGHLTPFFKGRYIFEITPRMIGHQRENGAKRNSRKSL